MSRKSLTRRAFMLGLVLALVLALGLVASLAAHSSAIPTETWIPATGSLGRFGGLNQTTDRNAPLKGPLVPSMLTTDTIIFDWDHQDFQGATDPIPVPVLGDYTGVRVWFNSVGTVHPDRADLRLCLRKDPASSPPTGDSYFRHSNWISFTQSVEGEMVYWCVPETPTGTGTSYEFSVDFSGNDTPAGNCDLGPTNDYCREDFGIVYDDNGTYKWVRSNNGRVLPGDRIDANVWWYLEVTGVQIEEALLDIFRAHKVSALAIDQDDYWLGTRGDGVIHYQSGITATETYSTGNSDLLHDVINDIAIASSGEVWIATNQGASQFDGSVWQNYTRTDGLSGNRVSAIAVSPSSAIWFGTNNGLSKYDGTAWITYTKQDGLPHNQLIALAIGEDEVLWGVTVNGTFGRFDGDTWETIEGSPKGNIDTMTIIDGVIYLGTNKGLVEYEDGTFSSIEPQVNINEVTGDSEGKLWAISESGELEVPLAVQVASNDNGVKVGIYDPQSGRWLVSLLDQTISHNIYLPIIFN